MDTQTALKKELVLKLEGEADASWEAVPYSRKSLSTAADKYEALLKKLSPVCDFETVYSVS